MTVGDYSALNPAPYADHLGPDHVVNLAGQHQGNRYCVTCQVPVGLSKFDQDQAAASVPVVAVVTGDGIAWLRERMILRAYRIKGEHGLNPTRSANLTIKGFNQAYGAQCRTWPQVAQVADYLLTRGDSK